MRSAKVWVLLLPGLIMTFSLGASTGLTRAKNDHSAFLPQTEKIVAGFDFSGMDKSVSACADFFQYANGEWIKRNPIPPAYSSWGRFQILDEGNLAVLHGILDSLAKQKLKPGSNEQKVSDYYQSCMDEAGIEAEGAKPLESELQRIDQIKDLAGVEEEIARFHAHRIPAVFGFGAAQDFKNSKRGYCTGSPGWSGLARPRLLHERRGEVPPNA
jgi:putative endopeptidase